MWGVMVTCCALLGVALLKKKKRVPGMVFVAIACYGVATHGLMFGHESTTDVIATTVFGTAGVLITLYLALTLVDPSRRARGKKEGGR